MEENTQQSNEELSLEGQGEQKESSPLEAQLEAVATQLAAEKEKHVRLMAEFDNMRKRHERERLDLIKYAHEEVIIECLKLYDDLDRSLKAFKASAEGGSASGGKDQYNNLVKGLEMVYNSMKELMARYDVKPIETVGKSFDPNTQEVLLQQETADVADGTVMEEFEKGYTLGGRVVRTAKVKVAKNLN